MIKHFDQFYDQFFAAGNNKSSLWFSLYNQLNLHTVININGWSESIRSSHSKVLLSLVRQTDEFNTRTPSFINVFINIQKLSFIHRLISKLHPNCSTADDLDNTSDEYVLSDFHIPNIFFNSRTTFHVSHLRETLINLQFNSEFNTCAIISQLTYQPQARAVYLNTSCCGPLGCYSLI